MEFSMISVLIACAAHELSIGELALTKLLHGKSVYMTDIFHSVTLTNYNLQQLFASVN